VALANPAEQARTLGLGRGRFTLPHDFDALHREEIQRMFEESD
jgi:hypothetical protein